MGVMERLLGRAVYDVEDPHGAVIGRERLVDEVHRGALSGHTGGDVHAAHMLDDVAIVTEADETVGQRKVDLLSLEIEPVERLEDHLVLYESR